MKSLAPSCICCRPLRIRLGCGDGEKKTLGKIAFSTDLVSFPISFPVESLRILSRTNP